MKSLLARLKNLPVLFKKHWWKIAIFSVLWKIVPIIIWWHYIEQWFVNIWSWWNSVSVWWHWAISLGVCLAIAFWCFIRGAAIVSQDEENNK
ncbi:MAG: hypothetical protein UR94_C0009G0019 [Parcubacteria group bacterium GW2011_GWA2_36_10]|nr:MAG: hypothetical protein UR94_C0009G0019 [Parcubacteria group bacterium GW2011_GWA2_36_10]